MRKAALLTAAAMATTFGLVAAGPAAVQANAPFTPVPTVDLGAASTFGAVTPAAFDATGASTFRGDTGSSTYTFVGDGHTGTKYEGADSYVDATNAVTAAYGDAAGRVAGVTALPALLDGKTFGPGVHKNAAAVTSTAGTAGAPTIFTIDGQGHPDAVFIFQVGGALGLGANTEMVLTGGAQAKNVFWLINGGLGIGAGTTFVGTSLANAAITVGIGSLVNGRLLTTAGAIAFAASDLYSAPPSVSINNGAASSSATSNPAISGVTSVVSPNAVTVTIDGVTQADQPLPAAGGAWSLILDGELNNSDHTVIATVSDGAGNTGTFTQTLTVAAPVPTITIDGGATFTTDDQTPTVSGTTDRPAGQSVELTLTRTNPALVLNRTALVQDGAASGTWNITPNGITGGEWTIVAKATDSAGNVTTATQVLNVNVIFAITSSNLTKNSSPVITGTVESGSTIAVIVDSLTFDVTLEDTIWSATTTSTFGSGTVPVVVTATAGGIDTVIRQDLIIDLVGPAITIDGGAAVTTNDTTPTIVGISNVSAGAVVSVSIDGAQPLTAVVQPNQSWMVTPSADLAPGVRVVVATVADPAGNTGTATQNLTVDAAAFVQVDPVDLGAASTFGAVTPAAFDATGASTFRGDTGSSTYTFVGDGHTGTKYEGADSYVDATNAVTAAYGDAAGRVAGVTALPALLDGKTFGPGVHKNAAAVTSTAGTAGAPTIFTIDGQGHPDAVFIFQVGGALGLGANTEMVLTGGAQAKNVFWLINGGLGIGAGTTFVGTSLANAAITVGIGSLVNGRLLTTAGAIAFAASDLHSSAPTVSINNGAAAFSTTSTPAISGTTSVVAPATVTVKIGGVTQADKPVPAVGGGWTLTPDGALLDGEYTVVATVSDGAGNTGTFTQILTIDTTLPVVAIDPGATNATDDVNPTITGTTDVAGTTVSINFSRTSPGLSFDRTAVSQSNKIWSFTPGNPTLSVGTWTIVAAIVDPAGNPHSATQTLTVLENPGGGGGGTTTGGTTTGGTTTGGATTGGATTGGATTGGATTGGATTDGGDTTGGGGIGGTTTGGTTTGGGGIGGTTGGTIDTTPTISGTNAEPGSTVTVTVGDETLTTTVDDNGNWTVTLLIPLSPGVHVALITITDADGNSVTTAQTVTVIASSSSGSNLVGPIRVFDTRSGQSPDALRAVTKKQVSGGYELEVQMTELATFTPTDGVGAVSMNVVSTGSRAAGYITAYDCGTRELVASVNFSAGETVGNAVIAPVSADGTVCFYSSTPTDIVVDMSGWFAVGETFTAVGPKRVFDTRPGQSPNSSRVVVKKQVSGGYELEVQMTALGAFVPANGVGAVSLNVTSTGSASAGFITAYSCGARELVSSVNFPAGGTVGNAVIAPLSSSGTVCFYSSTPTDIVVDINGWFAAGEGFTTVGPKRVFDTRPGQSPVSLRAVTKKQVSGGYELEVQMTGLGRFTPAAGMSAVSLNVTSTGSASAGFITVYSCGTRELVASVNFPAGGTVGNAVIVPLSSSGTVCFYSSASTDIVVDINAWFAA